MNFSIEEETLRWEDQNWAVDLENMCIHEILESEIVNDTLILYCTNKTNDSRNFTTVHEASGMEKIRIFIDSHFF
jgi:hypothetical protein